MVAGKRGNKGKKCPGGYWIPRENECRDRPGGTSAKRSGKGIFGPKVGPSGRKAIRKGVLIAAGLTVAGAIPIAAVISSIRDKQARERKPSWKVTEDLIEEKRRANERFRQEQEEADRRRRQAQADMDEAMRRAKDRARDYESQAGDRVQEEMWGQRTQGYQPRPEDRAREERVREEFRRAKEQAEDFLRRSQQRRAQSANPGTNPGTSAGPRPGTGPRPGAGTDPGSSRARNAAERSSRFAQEERDFAREFGLSDDAGRGDIKKARRKAAMQYHPDRFPGDEKARKAAEKRMQELNAIADRLMARARRDSILRVYRATVRKRDDSERRTNNGRF